jgi:hypothetical protein
VYHLRRRLRRAGIRGAASRAVARDRESALKLVELILLDAYSLLAAPAEPFGPGRVTQREALATLLVKYQLDFLFGARGLREVRRRGV